MENKIIFHHNFSFPVPWHPSTIRTPLTGTLCFQNGTANRPCCLTKCFQVISEQQARLSPVRFSVGPTPELELVRLLHSMSRSTFIASSPLPSGLPAIMADWRDETTADLHNRFHSACRCRPCCVLPDLQRIFGVGLSNPHCPESLNLRESDRDIDVRLQSFP